MPRPQQLVLNNVKLGSGFSFEPELQGDLAKAIGERSVRILVDLGSAGCWKGTGAGAYEGQKKSTVFVRNVTPEVFHPSQICARLHCCRAIQVILEHLTFIKRNR